MVEKTQVVGPTGSAWQENGEQQAHFSLPTRLIHGLVEQSFWLQREGSVYRQILDVKMVYTRCAGDRCLN